MLSITVNTLDDENDGVGVGDRSLRDAIFAATPGDFIYFDSSLNGGTIALTHDELEIAKELTIDGTGHNITINANGSNRIFNIADNTTGTAPPLVTLKNLTLTGAGAGGAIRSTARLSVQDCTITGNSSGIFVEVAGSDDRAVLTIDHSTIEDNQDGAGVAVFSGTNAAASTDRAIIKNHTNISHNDVNMVAVLYGAKVTVQDSTISFGMHGGAIDAELYDDASLTVTDCIITGNHSIGDGGAFHVKTFGSQMHIEGTSFTGNSGTTLGGAIYITSVNTGGSTLWIDKSKVIGNSVNTGSGNKGGGIFASISGGDSLTISNSTISGNSANEGGGLEIDMPYAPDDLGLGVDGTEFHMDHTVITGNSAAFRGGGLLTSTFPGGHVSVTDSVISGNGATTGGGMFAFLLSGLLDLDAMLTVSGSEISGNTASGDGGGLAVSVMSGGSRAAIYNSTISGNTASDKGGGVLLTWLNPNADGFDVDTRFENVTITKNTAAQGAGIYSLNDERGTNDVRLTNSIVSENEQSDHSPNNLFGSFNVDFTVSNLIGNGTTTYDYVTHDERSLGISFNDNPMLADLANNGGFTRTHRPLSGSAAIDTGSDTLAVIPFGGGNILWDQRGDPFARKFGASVDIGAHEVNPGRVSDVRLKGVQWSSTNHPADPWENGPISYAELVPLGKQLAPIYRAWVNQIEILFTDAMDVDPDALTLVATGERREGVTRTIGHTDFDPVDSTSFTWTFENLEGDRYRIDLDSSLVHDSNSQEFDGEWDNKVGTNDTLYYWQDDDVGRTLLPGNGTPGGNFQFLFALQPGDYNQDSNVNNLDYLMLTWLGSAGFDGDGNGVNGDNNDLLVWGSHWEEFLLFKSWQGDFNRDGAVNILDLARWATEYIDGGGTTSDSNGNGIVDFSDILPWLTWQDTIGPWYVAPFEPSSGPGLGEPNAGPRVVDVTISGSSSTHSPYSFANHVGSGDQFRSVTVGGADTISITFNENVNVAASDLRLVGFRTAAAPTLADFSYDEESMTATWRFENLIPNDNYIISLSDAVTDDQGYRLDGEWGNPGALGTYPDPNISEWPSGDGYSGGTFNFLVTILAGDANGDNIVNGDDYDILQNHWDQQGAAFSEGDFNGDGVVDGGDLALWELNEGLDRAGGIGVLGDIASEFWQDDIDWQINAFDLADLINHLGMSNPTLGDGDLNQDGAIDVADVNLLFAQYGLQLTVTI